MKCVVFSRKTTSFQSFSFGKTLDKFLVHSTRLVMASSGRLFGLHLPSVSSPLPDFVPAGVRSTHSGDAKECSGSSSSTGLLTVKSKLGILQQPQDLENLSTFELKSYTEQNDEVENESRDANLGITKKKVESMPWPSFGCNSSNSSGIIEGDATFHFEEAGENIHSHSCGLRSKLSSMLSLEKRVAIPSLPIATSHSSQFMMEMSRFQSTRRVPMADSKICAAIQKESFAHMFDLYDEKNLIASIPGYNNVWGGHMGRSMDAPDIGAKNDLSWIEEKSNNVWGTEPWHIGHHNILMKTLHLMRCDIESLKIVLRSLDLSAARGGPLDTHLHETPDYKSYLHSVMMKNNSTLPDFKQNSCTMPSNDAKIRNKEFLHKEDKELVSSVERNSISEVVQDLCTSQKSLKVNKDEIEEPTSVWSHHCSQKKKQWWKEILAAFKLTLWVITGAILAAKAIGVPNLGVTNNVASNRFWRHSDDEETKAPNPGMMEVVELTAFSFNDTIRKRPTFVMFYAPWCRHCQVLHPVWTQLANVLNKRGYDVQLAIVDATKHTKLTNKYEVLGFPTLIIFKNGMPIKRHRGARDIDSLVSFINNNK